MSESGGNLQSRWARLSPTKRALLERRLGRTGGDQIARTDAIRPRGQDGPARASFGQERLWFLDRLAPGNAAYNIAVAVDLAGPLDAATLEKAINEIVRRHETLRATFEAPEGDLLQVIAPQLTVPLRVVDVEATADDERDVEIRREASRPFDLARGPLVRTTLLRTDACSHILVLVIHHIISDAWSINVLLEELATVYGAFAAGRPSPLKPLAIQYGDFALHQRRELDDVGESQMAYWREHLSGPPPVVELPADRPRPSVQSFQGAVESMTLDEKLTASLAKLGRTEQASSYMVLLVAFKVLLGRYASLTDVSVGTGIANRDRAEVQRLIGFFVNTLLLRTDLSGEPSFREALGRVREVVLNAHANGDLPFERLVAELQPKRDLGRQPIFGISFVYLSRPLPSFKLGDVCASSREIPTGTTKFDLTFFVFDEPAGARVIAEYSTDLFEPTTIRRLLASYRTLLQSIVEDPDAPVGRLDLLAPAQRDELLTQLTDTETVYPREASLQTLFEAQVERTPQATALIDGPQQRTYAELNARANRIAHRLTALGVGSGVPVALALDRSALLIEAILGIVKAGGVYVPLDLDAPVERLAFMLNDTGAKVVLGRRPWLDRLGETEATVIGLDENDPNDREPETNPPVTASGGSTAYVMYTSGSTGRPKGIEIPHRSVTRLVINTDYVTLGAGERIAQASNASFDAATFEIWGALLTGACLVIVPREVVLSPKALSAAIRDQGITTLFVTTALFNRLAAEPQRPFGPLRCLLFGGEAVDPGSVRRVLQEDPPKRLVHVYGPTEGTTFTTSYEVREVAEDAKTVPIGRPIANTTVYLLDGRRQPVPIGAVGELYIGGDGLARGYLNQPKTTAEQFVDNPFDPGRGNRLYRSGDLARYRADGNLEFAGRIDDQVKVRGFRVEPGEIETLLARHPAVSEAIVLARVDASGRKRLVAYVVGSPGQPPATDELRRFLKAHLPGYMVPSAIVSLAELPLTTNGKIDRSALPEPGTQRPELEHAFVEPKSAPQRELSRIWTEILDVDRVGIDDDFFDLGGDSLLAVRLFALIEKRMGRLLPPASLFDAPTVRQLAEKLDDTDVHDTAGRAVRLQEGGDGPPLFLLPTAGDQVFCFRELVSLLGEDLPCYGLEAPGLDGLTESVDRMEELAGILVESIRRAQPTGPYHLCGHCNGGMIAFEMARQLAKQDEQVAFLVLLNTTVPQEKIPRSHNERQTPAGGGQIDWRLAAESARRLAGRFNASGGATPPPGASRVADVIEQVHGAGDEALRNYEPKPYPGRVVLFQATAEPGWGRMAADYGWAPLIRGGLEIQTLDCRHLQMLKPPFVGELAEKMGACLAEARARKVKAPTHAKDPTHD